MTFIYKHPKKE